MAIARLALDNCRRRSSDGLFSLVRNVMEQGMSALRSMYMPQIRIPGLGIHKKGTPGLARIHTNFF